MVLLTMTAAMVAAIKKYEQLPEDSNSRQSPENTLELLTVEPSLSSPKIGKPISHGQVIGISKRLRVHSSSSDIHTSNDLQLYSLGKLLQGSQVYTSPPEPKKEPVSSPPSHSTLLLMFSSQTSEYKALMAHLRAEEEARQYERMLSPAPPVESFSQRFPSSSYANLFPSSHERLSNTADNTADDEEITYADVNRQMALIANVLISIICCSVAIWMAASRWSTPKRLGLSMGGSGLVGIAEVAVYAGYLSRLQSAKEKERTRPEVKTVLKTWEVGGGGEEGKDMKPVILPETEKVEHGSHKRMRNRQPHKS
jgi:hypothetical protein